MSEVKSEPKHIKWRLVENEMKISQNNMEKKRIVRHKRRFKSSHKGQKYIKKKNSKAEITGVQTDLRAESKWYNLWCADSYSGTESEGFKKQKWLWNSTKIKQYY